MMCSVLGLRGSGSRELPLVTPSTWLSVGLNDSGSLCLGSVCILDVATFEAGGGVSPSSRWNWSSSASLLNPVILQTA